MSRIKESLLLKEEQQGLSEGGDSCSLAGWKLHEVSFLLLISVTSESVCTANNWFFVLNHLSLVTKKLIFWF